MSLNCQRQFQLSNYCSHDIQLHQQNCPPFFHLTLSCLLGLPLPVCDLLHGQALSSGGRVLLVPHMHRLPSVPAWCHVAAPSYRTQRAQLPVSRMAWLCIFHTQGIAQDCISHGGLAAFQGVKCLSWKLCLDSQGWLCWEEGILGVTRHQACRSLSSIYSTIFFLVLCLRVSMCESPAGYKLGLLSGALRLGRNFLFQPCWELCW